MIGSFEDNPFLLDRLPPLESLPGLKWGEFLLWEATFPSCSRVISPISLGLRALKNTIVSIVLDLKKGAKFPDISLSQLPTRHPCLHTCTQGLRNSFVRCPGPKPRCGEFFRVFSCNYHHGNLRAPLPQGHPRP